MPPCPRCAGTHVVRNGPNSAGTPTFRCRACGRRFVAAPAQGPVADDTTA
ncbi:MAG: IS1/IS1595 family N-terminal zinc-binding domain-containing protein, partial [Fimbriiglobus sp.]